MNFEAVLALIGNMYVQINALQARIDQLEAEKAKD